MPDFQWLLEAVLIVLLAATLFHAVRLERALGRLKRDRATLGALVAEFNDSTRQAENGIERLRQAADGAGRQIARQSEMAGALKGDLAFLVERGERLADRLDRLVRSGRGVETGRPAAPARSVESTKLQAGGETGVPAGSERKIMRNSGLEAAEFEDELLDTTEPQANSARVRSQAERDLLRALKMVR